MSEFTKVRVWPIAEWGEPTVHLIEVGTEVYGLTLCQQPARNPMKPTPPTDLIGLKNCAGCRAAREQITGEAA